MQKYSAPLLLGACFFCCLSSVVWCGPTYVESGGGVSSNAAPAGNHLNTLLSDADLDSRSDDGDTSNYDKRVERYAFGLGRRAYTYSGGGVKRLPVYNFGLGKRARPYSFGLGKRAEYEEEEEEPFNLGDYERNAAAFMDEKRSRPYSFGLGKRDVMDDVERRGYPNRYGFGLGRR